MFAVGNVSTATATLRTKIYKHPTSCHGYILSPHRLAYLSLRLVKRGLKACFLSVRGHGSLPEALCRLTLPLLDLPPQTAKFCIKRVPRHDKKKDTKKANNSYMTLSNKYYQKWAWNKKTSIPRHAHKKKIVRHAVAPIFRRAHAKLANVESERRNYQGTHSRKKFNCGVFVRKTH